MRLRTISFKTHNETVQENSHTNIESIDTISFESLAGTFTESELPWLDRRITFKPLGELAKTWKESGVLIAQSLIDDQLLDQYQSDWIQHNRINHSRQGGYPGPCPYMQVESLLNLATCQPIRQIINHLIGEEMGVHLALTGWKSTERNWHQDGYLNPDHNRDHYIAVWIALEDIHPDAGPFEYIPETHKLPKITNQNMLNKLEPHERDEHWPKHSERYLTPLFDNLRKDNNLQAKRFIARKGDVLFWHARLMHRGSAPTNPNLDRRAAILHYSGIHHRPDFPEAMQYENQGWYFPIDDPMEL